MDIGTRQYVNSAIGGTLGTAIAVGALAPTMRSPLKFAGGTLAGGLAGGLVAAAIVRDVPGEASGGQKLAAFGGAMATGAVLSGIAAATMGARGGAFLATAAVAGAAAGALGGMAALFPAP